MTALGEVVEVVAAARAALERVKSPALLGRILRVNEVSSLAVKRKVKLVVAAFLHVNPHQS
jgi:hypothetical protein